MYAAFFNRKKFHVNLHSQTGPLGIKSPAKSKTVVNSSKIGERPPRTRHRWEDNINMDLKEIGFVGCGLDSSGSGIDLWQVS
jgi:hypothetical protein